jgi:hypothetical protein
MPKKSSTKDTAADFARRSNATSRMRRGPQEGRPAIAGKDFSPRPMPRPARESDLAPSESMRPMTNPRRSDAVDRGNENIVLSRASRTTCCAVSGLLKAARSTASPI